MTLVLNGTTGVSSVDGSADTPAVQGTDTNTGVFFPAADTVAISTGGTEKVRVDSSGRVGVGTDSPSYAIDVSTTSSSITSAFRSSQSEAYIALKDSGTTIGNVRLGSSSNAMLMLAGGSERMRIDSSGNVTIGTNSAAARIHANTGSNAPVSRFYATGGTYTSEALQVITTQASSSSFNLAAFYVSDAAAYALRIRGDGNVYNANGVYAAASDQRLKENIVDASPKLDDLMQVQVRNYNLIGSDLKQIGVVAQELEGVFPSLVEETEDKDADGNVLGTTTKSVKYSVFIPILVKALQEANTKIDALEARIAALETP